MHFNKGSDGIIQLGVNVSMIFLVPPPSGSDSHGPETRTIKMQISTEIKPGVPTTIGMIEDVASTRTYELSVTAMPR